MAVDPSSVHPYSCLNYGESDGSLAGGGIDTSGGVTIDTEGAGSMEIIGDANSSGAGFATVRYRAGNGAIVEDGSLAISDTVPTPLSVSVERLLKLTTTAAIGVTTLQIPGVPTLVAEVDTDIRATLRSQRRLFPVSVSSLTSSKIFYDKTFWRNEAAGVMLEPVYRITADVSTKIRQGIALSKGDSVGTTKIVAPVGITFVDDNIDQSGDDLSSTESQGVWWELAAAIAAAPVKSFFTSQVSYQSI